MSSFDSPSQTTTVSSSGSTTSPDNLPPQGIPTPLKKVQLCSRIAETEPPIKVMHPIYSSLRGTDLGLDWALVEPIPLGLSDTISRQAVISQDMRRIFRPAHIILSVGNNSSVKGRLWPGVTMMRLSHQCRFVPVWSISVDTPIGEIFIRSFIRI